MDWISFVPAGGGSWLMARMVLTSALCLCAAGGAGLIDGEAWKDEVRKAVGKLEGWNGEVKDLKRGREVLEALLVLK